MRKYFKIPRPAKSEILAPAVPGEGARRDELAYRARGEGARARTLTKASKSEWYSSVLTMGTSSSGPAPMALAGRRATGAFESGWGWVVLTRRPEPSN